MHRPSNGGSDDSSRFCSSGVMSPITLPITGRRRLILHFKVARLRRSRASDGSLLDPRYWVSRSLRLLEPIMQVPPKIVTMLSEDLFSDLVQFFKNQIRHFRGSRGIRWVSRSAAPAVRGRLAIGRHAEAHERSQYACNSVSAGIVLRQERQQRHA